MIHIGSVVRKRQLKLDEDVRQDLDFIVAATLTLLGLIIGFRFSMAIGRYCGRTYANPKSRILVWPRLVRYISAALMSRCILPSEWATSNA
jgi:hypothetical protein